LNTNGIVVLKIDILRKAIQFSSKKVYLLRIGNALQRK